MLGKFDQIANSRTNINESIQTRIQDSHANLKLARGSLQVDNPFMMNMQHQQVNNASPLM